MVRSRDKLSWWTMVLSAVGATLSALIVLSTYRLRDDQHSVGAPAIHAVRAVTESSSSRR